MADSSLFGVSAAKLRFTSRRVNSYAFSEKIHLFRATSTIRTDWTKCSFGNSVVVIKNQWTVFQVFTTVLVNALYLTKKFLLTSCLIGPNRKKTFQEKSSKSICQKPTGGKPALHCKKLHLIFE